jgi:transcriptional regulator with XRE-family HTH domain
MMTFTEMLIESRTGRGMTQKDFAEALGFTPQYLCDLEMGRRLGSVEFVNRLCDWIRCRPKRRKEWHQAGARSHGWEI